MSAPTVSLCLVVRDEEGMLPAFLERSEGLWDELVVVDTGSVDRTVELLEAAGARVFHRTWTEDFSAARNHGLEQATGDWILVLDPDELVGPGFADELRALIAREELGAGGVLVRNLFQSGQHRDSHLLRLFRRDDSIRFEHAIHEDVSRTVSAYLTRTGRRMERLFTPVEHLGYTRTRASEKSKKERDLEILGACVERDASDLYSRFKLLELGRFWSDPGLSAQVASELFEALESGVVTLTSTHVGAEALVLAARSLHAGKPLEALARIEAWEASCEPSPAFLFGRGELRELAGDLSGAHGDFQACLGRTDPNPQLVTTRPLLGLARLALADGELDGALARIDEALDHSPQDPEALLAAMALRLPREGAVDEFLGRHPWGDAVRDALRAASENSARWRLEQGEVDSAQELLLSQVERVPQLGIGVVVCDLVMGRSSDLELELALEEADEILHEWADFLEGGSNRLLWARFVEFAPALSSLFPWLAELEA